MAINLLADLSPAPKKRRSLNPFQPSYALATDFVKARNYGQPQRAQFLRTIPETSDEDSDDNLVCGNIQDFKNCQQMLMDKMDKIKRLKKKIWILKAQLRHFDHDYDKKCRHKQRKKREIKK